MKYKIKSLYFTGASAHPNLFALVGQEIELEPCDSPTIPPNGGRHKEDCVQPKVGPVETKIRITRSQLLAALNIPDNGADGVIVTLPDFIEVEIGQKSKFIPVDPSQPYGAFTVPDLNPRKSPESVSLENLNDGFSDYHERFMKKHDLGALSSKKKEYIECEHEYVGTRHYDRNDKPPRCQKCNKEITNVLKQVKDVERVAEWLLFMESSVTWGERKVIIAKKLLEAGLKPDGLK